MAESQFLLILQLNFSASFAFTKHLCTVSTIEECSSNFKVFYSISFEIWLSGNFFLMNQIFLSYSSHNMTFCVVEMRCLLIKSNFMLVNTSTCDYRGFISCVTGVSIQNFQKPLCGMMRLSDKNIK